LNILEYSEEHEGNIDYRIINSDAISLSVEENYEDLIEYLYEDKVLTPEMLSEKFTEWLLSCGLIMSNKHSEHNVKEYLIP